MAPAERGVGAGDGDAVDDNCYNDDVVMCITVDERNTIQWQTSTHQQSNESSSTLLMATTTISQQQPTTTEIKMKL